MPSPWHQRLAFSTNGFKKTSLTEAIEAIADIGYAGCEIMADRPHMAPIELTRRSKRYHTFSGEIEALRRQIESRGLRVSNVNAFTGFFAAGDEPTGDTYHPTWIEHDEAARRMRAEHTLGSIYLAGMLGAPSVSVQPGGPLIGTGLTRGEAGRRFAEAIDDLIPAACDNSVALLIEPEPGLFLQTTAEYLDWKETWFAGSEMVKMNFDVGHAFCVGEDPAAVARELAGEYAHVHLEDIAKTRVHQHLVPGEGAIDFPALFAALEEAGYDGWITVELYPFMSDPAGVARRAMEHLDGLAVN